jgi:nucleoid-associated protein YgaU
MADNGATPRNSSALQVAAVTVAALLAVGAGIWFGYAPTRQPAPPAQQAVQPPAPPPAPAKETASAASPAAVGPTSPPAAPPAQSASATPAPVATPTVPAAPTGPVQPTAQPPATMAAAPATNAPAPVAQAEAAPPKPSFDIVRVNPQGGAVMAGRAAPGAEVTVAENGKAIGSTKADDAGQWVLLPQKPISPGNSELTVASREPDQKPVEGAAPVVILMPERPAAAPSTATNGPTLATASPPAPVVLLTPNDAAPRLLQPPPVLADTSRGRTLGLATVDYTDQGDIRFAGTAPPGTTVRTYIDNKPMGDAAADDSGHWTLVPHDAVATGDHQLRLDALGKGGVTSRIELPFQRAELSPQTIAPGSVIVQPGQNLWRIARGAYGRGVQYVVIYQANRDQIRDPNLIYPGQVFAMPASEKSTATP